MKNIEFKAVYPDLAFAHNKAKELGAVFQWRRQQIDTYFNAKNGRLKLRETEGRHAELIGYTRSDEPKARQSDYEIFATENSSILKEILSKTLGVRVVVDKIRTLFLFKNVRIHLDEVKGLGTYMEFEAVIASDEQIAESQKIIEQFRGEFKITEEDIIPFSYADLLS